MICIRRQPIQDKTLLRRKRREEGRRQRAEGSNMVWASLRDAPRTDPHQLQATCGRDFGGGLKPLFPPVTGRGHEAELPSA